MRLQFYLYLFLWALSPLTWAADPEIYSHKRLGAIKGADVVAYYSLHPGQPAVMGSDDFTYEWKSTVWKFASAENRDAFIKNPEAYAPQYGGYCAFAMSHNFTTSIRPNSWSIIDGKLYLNHNGVSSKKFLKSPEEHIAKANDNWPNVLKKCERRNRCKKPFLADSNS